MKAHRTGRLGLIAVAIAVTVTASACTGKDTHTSASPGTTAPAAAKSPKADGSYLFTVNAASGSADGTTLTLNVDSHDTVTVFSDRPARRASRTTISDMVAGWKATFGSDAPNAAIVTGVGGHDQTSVAVLEQPALAGNVLTLHYRPVSDTGLDQGSGDLPNGTFGRVSVFVDGAACPLMFPIMCPGADLSEQDLTGVNFEFADLQGANMSYSNFTGDNFTEANLTNANMSYSEFWSTNLTGATLDGANIEMFGIGNSTICPDGGISSDEQDCDASIGPAPPSGFGN